MSPLQIFPVNEVGEEWADLWHPISQPKHMGSCQRGFVNCTRFTAAVRNVPPRAGWGEVGHAVITIPFQGAAGMCHPLL